MSPADMSASSLGAEQTRFEPKTIVAEIFARERRLARFGGIMLLLLIPMALAMLVDERSLRGFNVWIKPAKFALSIALFSWTTAWFIGHLPATRRRARPVDWIVWLLIGAGSFEIFYITLQAALGQASHYNVADTLHAVMYSLMGVGALILTATQPMLAWQLFRHPDRRRPAALRMAILLGLLLTFVLGAGVGGLLSGIEPSSGGPTLPLIGWSLVGGDLRPAHFIGIHAQQLLPLAGCAAVAIDTRRARTIVLGITLAYGALFVALLVWGLAGRT